MGELRAHPQSRIYKDKLVKIGSMTRIVFMLTVIRIKTFLQKQRP